MSETNLPVMRRCVVNTCPDSSLKRMYLPRRPTPVMSELRSCRSNAGRVIPGAMRLRFSSAARMRRPVTSGANALTTCSTSGSSGIRFGRNCRGGPPWPPVALIMIHKIRDL